MQICLNKWNLTNKVQKTYIWTGISFQQVHSTTETLATERTRVAKDIWVRKINLADRRLYLKIKS